MKTFPLSPTCALSLKTLLVHATVGLFVFLWSGIAEAAIARVQLTSPANLTADVAPCVTLQWQSASGATGYEYEVKQGDTVVAAGGSGGATSLSLTLQDITTYTWRVRGRTSQNNGAWSPTWTFTTKTPIPAASLQQPADGQTRLEEECARTGHGALCSELEPVMHGDDTASSYAEIAGRLGMTTGAVTTAAHRIRARLSGLIREEVLQTVASETELQSELRYLLELSAR